MKLTVFSYKCCWRDPESPTGYASDGGFPFQMAALSELFDSTVLVMPEIKGGGPRSGGRSLTGRNLSVCATTLPSGQGFRRKLALPVWAAANAGKLALQAWRADAVHAPIPGDIGTIGMCLAFGMRKPLFVRHCGNWYIQRTNAERFWRWFMERFAGGRNVMLATGGGTEPPSRLNPNVQWVFSTTLTHEELARCAAPRTLGSGPVRLVTVGRQERGKRTDLLLRSAALLAADFPELSVEVVGGGSELPRLKELADRLGLATKVTFHGQLTHEGVLGVLDRGTLFCSPTESEGFPKAILEALACGLPVVTTPVSVLPQLLANGCGVLVPDPAPETFAQAVSTCLLNRDAYSAMSEMALETARGFSLEKWRDSIGSCLQHAWGKPLAAGI